MKATTENPALVLFLVDGSHSTGISWSIDEETGAQATVSQSIQDGVNRALHDLVVNVCYDDGQIKERILLGAYTAQGNEIAWALDSEEPAEGWASIHEWVERAEHPDEDGALPVWIQLEPKGKTPLMEGWRHCLHLLGAYYRAYPNGSALLVTLTDGMFEELGLTQAIVDELVNEFNQAVNEDTFVHLIGHIDADGGTPLLFPSQRPDGAYQGWLFDLTTTFPPHILEAPVNEFNGVTIDDEARTYIHNADHVLLSALIQLGSRFVDGDVRPASQASNLLEEE